MADEQTIKVFLSCTGADLFRGGHETFARDCFEGLRGHPGLDIALIKSAAPEKPDEPRVWCLRRSGWPARLLGRLTGRSAYAIEQNSSLLSVMRLVRRDKPDVIFSSDADLLRRLKKLRKWFGKPIAIIHSNGAPMRGPGDAGIDQVQQVTPPYYDDALSLGGKPVTHSLVPYGFTVPPGPPETGDAARRAARAKLELPVDRPIVISVGWVSPTHKRMDHLVREVALLPEPRPFVVMLGRLDESTQLVRKLADELLGSSNYRIASVPHELVADYYRAADVFALCSLIEGFGRAYVEAMIQGLPVVAHNDGVMKYVVGDQGVLADMTKPGELASAIRPLLERREAPEVGARRREVVRERFGWAALAPEYMKMFRKAIGVAKSNVG